MTRNIIQYVLIVSIFFLSCKSKNENSKAAISFGIIYPALTSALDDQGKFMDKAADALNAIKYNPNAVIDVAELHSLLNLAETENEKIIPELNLSEEVDTEIMFKTKSVKFVLLLDSIYKNQFTEALRIMNIKDSSRWQKCSDLLLARITEVEQAGKSCLDAAQAMRTKYNIQVVDSSATH